MVSLLTSLGPTRDLRRMMTQALDPGSALGIPDPRERAGGEGGERSAGKQSRVGSWCLLSVATGAVEGTATAEARGRCARLAAD